MVQAIFNETLRPRIKTSRQSNCAFSQAGSGSLFKRLRFKREAILKEEVKCKCDYTKIVAMSLDLRERKS